MPKFIAELQTACNVWEVHLAIRYDAIEPTRPNQPYLATGVAGLITACRLPAVGTL